MKSWLKGGLIGILFTVILHLIWFIWYIIDSAISGESEMPGLGIILIPSIFISSLVPFFILGVILGIIIPKIRAYVKNYTLTGVITGGLIGISLSGLFLVFILRIINDPRLLLLNLGMLITLIISSIIIGTIVGFIVGKVKEHKEKVSQVN